jgi:hypothetical protein
LPIDATKFSLGDARFPWPLQSLELEQSAAIRRESVGIQLTTERPMGLGGRLKVGFTRAKVSGRRPFIAPSTIAALSAHYHFDLLVSSFVEQTGVRASEAKT